MRFTNGYVKLYRLTDEHWLWDEPKARFVFDTLLILATYRPTKKRVRRAFEVLPPGTVITSLQELALKCGYSIRNIRTALDVLQSASTIDKQSTNKGSIIHIVNWDTYQILDGVPDKQTASKRQSNDKRPTNDRQLIEEEKKERKKEDICALPKKPAAATPKMLVDLWNATCPSLRGCKELTEKRKKAALVRLKEKSDLGYWESIFKRLEASNFCQGLCNKPGKHENWKANFEFAMRQDTHIRVLEGEFDNKPTSAESFEQKPQSWDWRAELEREEKQHKTAEGGSCPTLN